MRGPSKVGLRARQTLIGGVLPPGAMTAEVVDIHGARRVASVGGGAWIAVLNEEVDGRSSPACFRDAGGVLVRPPLPADWSRRPIEDVDDPCPACGERGWEEVIPMDGSRGMRGGESGAMEPMPLAVCRSCGHEEPVGAWATMKLTTSPTPEARRRQADAMRARLRERRRRALSDVRFPIYVAAGRPAKLSGWGGGEEGVEEVTVGGAKRPEADGQA